jgi:hypothetical protein
MGALVRRAEATLVDGAARNAAAGVEDERARRLDELRTLRELRALGAAPPVAARRATRR